MPPGEVFVVFIFVGCACSSDHTPTLIHIYVHYVAIRNGLVKIFVVLIFAVTRLSTKTAKICTPRKFPAIRYMHQFQWDSPTIYHVGSAQCRPLTETSQIRWDVPTFYLCSVVTGGFPGNLPPYLIRHGVYKVNNHAELSFGYIVLQLLKE